MENENINNNIINFENEDVEKQAETELTQLERLNRLAQQVGTLPDLNNAKIVTPVQQVEKSLSRFIDDAFTVTREDFELGKVLNKVLGEKILNKEFNENQLIALFNGFQVNMNDKISKLVAPTLQLMTTRQQAEISAQAQVQAAEKQGSNITSLTSINQSAPKEVLLGVKQLTDVLTLITQKNKELKEQEEAKKFEKDVLETEDSIDSDDDF
jgi:hypothetical protein